MFESLIEGSYLENSCLLKHVCCTSGRVPSCTWHIFDMSSSKCVSPVYSEACSESRVVFLILLCMKCIEQCWQLKYGLSLTVSVTVCLKQGYRLLHIVL